MVGLLGFVGTWAGRFLLQTETTGQAVVALAPTRARLVPNDLLDGVDTLACCSPCPWACHRRRDLSSTGSSGILILGGASRSCLLIAGRLRPACVHLVRAYRWRASGGRDTRPGGPQQPTSVSALSSWPGCAADRSTSGGVLSHGVGRRRCRRGSNFSRQVRRQPGILAGDPGRGARMPRTMVPRHPDYGPPMAPD